MIYIYILHIYNYFQYQIYKFFIRETSNVLEILCQCSNQLILILNKIIHFFLYYIHFKPTAYAHSGFITLYNSHNKQLYYLKRFNIVIFVSR